MRSLLSILFILFISLILNAQIFKLPEYFSSRHISCEDSVRMVHIPALEVPEIYKKGLLSLPYMMDNSTKPYFRPITWQSGYECGQTAGIAFVFTYEINRLRNLSASLPQNQYHTHFSWNFMNNGYNYQGVSFFDTWEITRTCGNPNITDYGALYAVSESYWMSGYTKYYNAMKNRIKGVYGIRCDTEEGINSLKAWIYDHLEGSNTGGVGAFYATYCGPNATLPAGTTEAGKSLITYFGTSASHAWTVAGYNDSIRYDFNNDGQYTNHIDINGDGIVDVRDWEIGGIKIANGYSGTGWGNGGFSYVMYKTIADGMPAGGVWNSTVYVLKAKETQNPQLTMKINLKHNVRNQIKVIAGINNNTSATAPDVRLEFPIFNFQGGPYYMQGDSTEAGKNIEFGLDISPLLSHVNSAQPCKFFLEVVEKDPGGTGTGQINAFSIIDYTLGINESFYPSTNIPLVNNDTTRLAITRTILFTPPVITTDSINAKINTTNTKQLLAQNGTSPYSWSLKMDYQENVTTSAFPLPAAEVLNTGNSGYVVRNIPFDFPFFGSFYNKIYVYADGFVKFDNFQYYFPYMIVADLLFKSHKMIAPFHADLTYGTGKNVTFEADMHSATIVWNARISGQSTSNVNVALKIFDSGKVEFYYGNININGNWASAISGGDVVNYHYTSLSNSFTNNTVHKKVALIPPDYPALFNLTESGMCTSVPQRFHDTYIKFCVNDNNNIYHTKNILYKTYGIEINYAVDAGGDTIVHAGDTVLVTVKLKNRGINLSGNTTMTFTSQDSCVFMLDTVQTIPPLANGDSITIANVFSFIVSGNAHDGHLIDLSGKLVTPTDTFVSDMVLRVNTFLLTTGNVTILDGNNNILEPNETAAMMLEIKNIGGAAATNLSLTLTTTDNFITLNPASAYIDTILPDSSKNVFFIITTASNTPADHLIVMNALITGNNNFTYNTFFFIQMGSVMEDFETGDFTKYDWLAAGNQNWIITDSATYQGGFSARSGMITHNESSHLSINRYVLADGHIRFHRKVSCEKDPTNQNWDYLAFYIDGVEKARWDGEVAWDQVSFPVEAGNRTFKWSYIKDYSVSTGADCAWLDNIIFPICGDPAPDIIYMPNAIYKTVAQNTSDTAQLIMFNAGTDLVLFSNTLMLPNNMPVPWAAADISAGGINAGEHRTIVLNLDATLLQEGSYDCQLIVNENFITETVIPVYLTVDSQSSVKEFEIFSAACYPNPFSSKLTIQLDLKNSAEVSVKLYDFTGRYIAELCSGSDYGNGIHTFLWDGTNSHGQQMANGIYFCNIIVSNTLSSFKVILSR